MSNRNFDSRVIIQRLQNQVNANNLYRYQQTGKQIISNPQVSDPSVQRILSYREGVETTYYNSVYGTLCSSPSGILNLVATNNISPEPSPLPPPYVYEYWALSLGGTGSDVGNGITTDTNNNVYVTGQYASNPLRISSFSTVSSGVIQMAPFGTLANISSNNTNDAFVAKYDSSGIAQWVLSLGGTGSEIGNGIATDQNNNVYVIGQYSSNPLGISSFSTVSSGIVLMSPFGTLLNTGFDDAFIVKYNSSGLAQWATSLDGTSLGGIEIGNEIATDTNNNVYVTGSYSAGSGNELRITSFSTVSSGTILMSSFGTLIQSGTLGTDAFIVKYNSSGIAQWATSLGGTSSEIGYGITSDTDNNVYVTGQYNSGPLQIFSFSTVSSATIQMSSFGRLVNTGTIETFVVKYNSSGIAQWAVSLVGTGNDIGRSITTDQNNNIYITGQYAGTLLQISSFSTVSSGTIQMSSFGRLVNTGIADAFVVKYNSSGIVQWATNLGGTNNDAGNEITTDLNNNVYVTGLYSSGQLRISSFSTVTSAIIQMSSFGTLENVNTGLSDTFVVKYNSSGIVQAATRFSGYQNDIGRSITTDQNNNIYITGQYASNPTQISGFSTVSSGIVLLSSFGTLANVSTNVNDVFVVKMNSSLQMY
jgi:hypothetical protein